LNHDFLYSTMLPVGKWSRLADNAAHVVGRVTNQADARDLSGNLFWLEFFCLRLAVFSLQ